MIMTLIVSGISCSRKMKLGVLGLIKCIVRKGASVLKVQQKRRNIR
jgi:hypothetical protein